MKALWDIVLCEEWAENLDTEKPIAYERVKEDDLGRDMRDSDLSLRC